MTRLVSRFAPALLAVIATAGVAQAHVPDGEKFVIAFRQACVPGRLSYSAAREHIASVGWKDYCEKLASDGTGWHVGGMG